MPETIKLDKVEQWTMVQIDLCGSQVGNPFVDVQLAAEFSIKNRIVSVDGFCDGGSVYCIRFMPDTPGEWQFVTRSNCAELNDQQGQLTCIEPSTGNHGPVGIRNTFHFGYADGTRYTPIGTTCYAWVHQGDVLEEQTLETLDNAPFNKLRMCVFPKDYAYNRNEPEHHPFVQDSQGGFDHSRFDPHFWRHLELRIRQLLELGIEADLILFHPYDRWGFATMDAEADDRYLRYAIARLAAFRNVWWSMANEYDLVREKSMADWDRFFHIIQECDPYGHLRSIHNCRQFYDHGKPWVTHCSVQSSALDRVPEWRSTFRKPVVVDECCYEGNIPQGWGNISAQELVHRFWLGTVGGGYVGHGETYLHPQDVLWWSKGGELHGESPARIAFLRKILQDAPVEEFEPVEQWGVGKVGTYYLYYWGVHQPGLWTFDLPEGGYWVEVIDTWEMTVLPLEGTYRGRFQVGLPGKPYLAVRIRRAT
jgi:hypothetical protein